jgi:transposase InsO family protein
LIEATRYAIQIRLREAGQVSSLRKVLAQQAVGVFVRPTLPRTLGIAEIDLHVRRNRELLVRLAADITACWTRAGWCYLAVILDLASRRVVGWAVRNALTTELVLAALAHALPRLRHGHACSITPIGAADTPATSIGRSSRATVSERA